MRVLYIESSPRKDRSHSIKLAKAFLKEFKQKNPNAEIDLLDLWKEPLPPFNGDTVNAKYAVIHQQNPTDAQKNAWDVVKKIAHRFTSADKYVFSVPMWNFHIPYPLKHYIDVITQPGLTFVTENSGYKGLVSGKPAIIFYASGGSYPKGTPGESFDFQKPYMRVWLQFVGFTDIRELADEGTLGAGGGKGAALIEEAVKMAGKF